MESYIIVERSVNGGVQKIYKFDNGYGASVVRHLFSYGGEQGLWEMALLSFDDISWHITYREDFANGDVAGYLSDKDVLELLEWIKRL